MRTITHYDINEKKKIMFGMINIILIFLDDVPVL